MDMTFSILNLLEALHEGVKALSVAVNLHF